MQNLTSLAQTVGTLLIERKQTLAISESSSGGLISAALLSIPGASAYFMGG
ncbi:MAG: damage-inducible protein, partial [Rhodospirillaceae bacterium]|nr:damage-inducible protein [Rhodospirillaceae bacterium]